MDGDPDAAPVLRVGCAMWAHPDWPGRHTPESSARRGTLAAYASWCTAVEGNTTFYGEPAASTVAAWGEEAPAGFRFVFKLPRSITHERRLHHADGLLASFLERIAPLGSRARQLSIQLPATFGPDELGTLARFLATVPATLRFGVEVRHPRFFDGSAPSRALARLLADHDCEWIGFDTTVLFSAPPTSEAERGGWAHKPRVARRIAVDDAITDHPIVRYLGRDDPEATIAGWAPWIPVVATWLAEGRRPTFFVHTPDNLDAPVLARRFHDDVRAAVPSLAPLPEPERPTAATLF